MSIFDEVDNNLEKLCLVLGQEAQTPSPLVRIDAYVHCQIRLVELKMCLKALVPFNELIYPARC